MPDYQVSTTFTAHDKVSGVTKGMSMSVHKYGNDAEKAFAKAERSARRAAMAQHALQKTGSALKTGAMAVGTGVAAGAVGLTAALDQIIGTGDRLNDTANAIGMTTKALQEYEYVAALSGVETEAMDAALSKLTVQLGKGGSAVEEALGAIGLTVEEMRATKPDQILEKVADAMQNVTDPTVKAAAVTALFGKSNIKMVNALSGGSEGLRELRDEAHKAGYVMSDELIKASADNDDQMNRLKATFRGVTNEIGAKLIPIMTKGVNKMIDFLQTNKDAIASGIDKFFDRMISIGEKLAPVFNFVGKIFDKIGEVFDALAPVLETIGQIFEELAPIVEPIMDVFKELAKTLGKVLAQAFQFLKPIINAFVNIFTAIGPLISRIVDKVGTFIAAILKALGPALEKLMPVLEKVFIELFKAAEPILSAILDIFTDLAPIIGAVAEVLVSVLGPALELAMEILKPILKFVGDLLKGIHEVLKFVGLGGGEDAGKGSVSAAEEANKKIETMRQAPNSQSADARQANVNFQGQLNISGAPSGSTIQSTTTGAPPVKTNLMGAPAR